MSGATSSKDTSMSGAVSFAATSAGSTCSVSSATDARIASEKPSTTISLTYSVYSRQACDARGTAMILFDAERSLAILAPASAIALSRVSWSVFCCSANSVTSYVFPSFRWNMTFVDHSASSSRVFSTLPLMVSRMWFSSFTALITSWM